MKCGKCGEAIPYFAAVCHKCLSVQKDDIVNRNVALPLHDMYGQPVFDLLTNRQKVEQRTTNHLSIEQYGFMSLIMYNNKIDMRRIFLFGLALFSMFVLPIIISVILTIIFNRIGEQQWLENVCGVVWFIISLVTLGLFYNDFLAINDEDRKIFKSKSSTEYENKYYYNDQVIGFSSYERFQKK